jgi:hypothetical protein
MITAQVLSIVAFLISWIWWVVWLISLASLIFYQMMWCTRVCKAGIIAASLIATVAGIFCLLAGIIMLSKWENVNWCISLFFFTGIQYDDDDESRNDSCPEVALAIVAFIDAALWLASAGCTFVFLKSGRYARIEAELIQKSRARNGGGAVVNASVIEMGNIHPAEQVAGSPNSFASATPVSDSFPAATAAYASSEAVGKVDNTSY